MNEFIVYIKELQSESIANITEHSKRSALETLLKIIAVQKNGKIKVLHEPKRIENYGSPDFLIYTDNSIIGYVENKNITENLDKIIKSEQIKKYLELSDNILLTNYIEFIWLNIKQVDDNKEIVIKRENLCYLTDIENLKFKLDKDKTERVRELIYNFYSQAPTGISSAKELSFALAVRAKNLKAFLYEELKKQDRENRQGRLFGLYKTFLENISSDLTIEQFTDAYAQMLVYGLFLAKLNADNKQVTLRNADEFIPQSFQLIRELVGFLKDLEKREYVETKWIVEETITILNNLELSTIREQLSLKFGIKNNQITNEVFSDPYIYFYEDFLSYYDKKMRKAKGVYYTPPQVVYFIVTSINQILKTEFLLHDGFADYKNVTALDFATGTGTFLIEIFKQVFNSIPFKSQSLKNITIKEHLLKNIYGFEYLIAPYTITHLKLSQFLKDNGYEMTEEERLQVYLTNTIEPLEPSFSFLLPDISNEGTKAQHIKKQPILIITGNPPYSISSTNKHPETQRLLEIYKQGLDEQKINLDDDYIKFIRFAQDKIVKYGKGVVGIITNNSYLDGLTHRRMRETLYNDFDKIYVLNLHGNGNLGEPDKNVFDIKVGVSIILLVKLPKPLKNKEVYYYSTLINSIKTREQKYNLLLNNDLKEIDWQTLNPQKPYFWFVDKDIDINNKYNDYYSLSDIFVNYGSGIKTERDSITIHQQKGDLMNVIYDFNELSEYELKQKYELKDSRDWKVVAAKKDISQNYANKEKYIQLIHYRPFDFRYIFYTGKSRGFVGTPQSKIANQFIEKQNIGLAFKRQNKKQPFSYVLVTKNVVESCLFESAYANNVVAPLYIYPKNDKGLLENERKPNFTEAFNKFIVNQYAKNIEIGDKNLINEKIKTLQKVVKNFERNIKDLEKFGNHAELLNTLRINIEDTQKQIEIHKNQLQQTDNQNSEVPNPEQILGYIYAILHSPTYRDKYYEYLKIDFPKIPFTTDIVTFQKLSNLGETLIECHLMQKNDFPNEYNHLGGFMGEGDRIIKKVEYNDNKIFINNVNFFDNISHDIWNYEIGGRKVLDYWLKARKERELNLDEIKTVSHIAKIIAFSIQQIEIIEIETKNWV